MEFNDVRLQYEKLREEIDGAISGALGSGRYVLGPAMELFENEFARYCGAAVGIGTGSGTGALTIGLRALGVGRGDDVLVPAMSAAATAMAVALVGARPVFVDISPSGFNMDPSLALQSKTSRTKAVIPVHLYGMPAELKQLSKLGVAMLEDACQAHGSQAGWGRCGSFGDAAAFSFYPTKNLGAYGDGGMLVTSDAAIAKRARLLRNYGQREHYASDIIGDNDRLDDLQAAILRLKLKRLDEWNRRRGQIAQTYRAELRNLPIKLQSEAGKSNYHLFVIAVSNRDKLRAYLAEHDIPTLVHYPIPLHRQKAFADFLPARCPNADQLSSQALSLPIHAQMTDGDVDRVVEAMKAFFRHRF